MLMYQKLVYYCNNIKNMENKDKSVTIPMISFGDPENESDEQDYNTNVRIY